MKNKYLRYADILRQIDMRSYGSEFICCRLPRTNDGCNLTEDGLNIKRWIGEQLQSEKGVGTGSTLYTWLKYNRIQYFNQQMKTVHCFDQFVEAKCAWIAHMIKQLEIWGAEEEFTPWKGRGSSLSMSTRIRSSK